MDTSAIIYHYRPLLERNIGRSNMKRDHRGAGMLSIYLGIKIALHFEKFLHLPSPYLAINDSNNGNNNSDASRYVM